MSEIENGIVIGSHSVGDTAAICLARTGVNPTVPISVVEAGGAWVDTSEVENFPSHADGIVSPQLMENMRRHTERSGVRVAARACTQIPATGSAHHKFAVDREQRFTSPGVFDPAFTHQARDTKR